MPRFNTFAIIFVIVVGVIYWLWEKDPGLSPETRKTLDSASKLFDQGVAHYDDSDYHLAVAPFTKATVTYVEEYGLARQETLDAIQYLVYSLSNDGQTEKAYGVATFYLEKIKSTLGKESRPYADIELTLGHALASLERYEEAVEVLRHAKDLHVKYYGVEDTWTLSVMHELNLALSNAGQFEEAIEAERYLLEVRRRILGTRDRETIKTIGNLASVLKKTGEVEEAAELEKESLKLREEVFGMEHPETHIMRVNHALSLEEMGHVEESIQLCRRAYDFFRTHYAEGHPDILWSGTNLYSLLSDHPGNEEKLEQLAKELGLE